MPFCAHKINHIAASGSPILYTNIIANAFGYGSKYKHLATIQDQNCIQNATQSGAMPKKGSLVLSLKRYTRKVRTDMILIVVIILSETAYTFDTRGRIFVVGISRIHVRGTRLPRRRVATYIHASIFILLYVRRIYA